MKTLMGEQRKQAVADLSLDDISSAYIGISGACCCGCSGTHYYRHAARDEASKQRGYSVMDDEINDEKIEHVLTVLRDNVASVEFFVGDFVSVDIGDQLYMVCFSPTGKKKQYRAPARDLTGMNDSFRRQIYTHIGILSGRLHATCDPVAIDELERRIGGLVALRDISVSDEALYNILLCVDPDFCSMVEGSR